MKSFSPLSLLCIFFSCTLAVQISTDKGPVIGLVSEKTYTFKGIPYAAPPIGDLRWKSPKVIIDKIEFIYQYIKFTTKTKEIFLK